MLKFCAHFNYLFQDIALEERFPAARDCGFKAIEFPMPHLLGLERFHALAQQHGLKMVETAIPNASEGPGRKGFACLADMKDEFQLAVERGLEAVRILKCDLLHPMAGIMPQGATRDELLSLYMDNMRYALRRCQDANVRMMIEPISDESMPGYFMNHPDLAMDVLDELGSEHAVLMFDLYHADVKGVDSPAFISDNFERIAHVQVADNPGRHEPGTGNIDFDASFRVLEAEGYQGWIGLEYVPSGATRDSFGWMDKAQRAVAAAG